MLRVTACTQKQQGLRNDERGGGCAVISAGPGSLLKPRRFWLSNGAERNRCKPMCQEKCRLDWTVWHGPDEWRPLPQTKQNTFECYLSTAESVTASSSWRDSLECRHGGKLGIQAGLVSGRARVQCLFSQSGECSSERINKNQKVQTYYSHFILFYPILYLSCFYFARSSQ